MPHCKPGRYVLADKIARREARLERSHAAPATVVQERDGAITARFSFATANGSQALPRLFGPNERRPDPTGARAGRRRQRCTDCWGKGDLQRFYPRGRIPCGCSIAPPGR